QLVPHQVHEVGRVLAVVDGEARIEADRVRMHPEQPGADGVEGAGPNEPAATPGASLAERGGDDALGAALHLGGGAPGEGEEQDAARVGTVDDGCATRCASVLVLP